MIKANWGKVLKVVFVYPAVIDVGYGKLASNMLYGNLTSLPMLTDCVIGFIAGTFGLWLLVKDLIQIVREGV